MKLQSPYWASKDDKFPTYDFNKEIIEPKVSITFPKGAVGIRVDDNFWQIAALPLSEFRHVSIEKIVEHFWPNVKDATFNKDE